jgi:hypothetical protein
MARSFAACNKNDYLSSIDRRRKRENMLGGGKSIKKSMHVCLPCLIIALIINLFTKSSNDDDDFFCSRHHLKRFLLKSKAIFGRLMEKVVVGWI